MTLALLMTLHGHVDNLDVMMMTTMSSAGPLKLADLRLRQTMRVDEGMLVRLRRSMPTSQRRSS
jgi:hypothetical protein